MPAGRPREFDPDRCLDIAMQEFWRRGYDSTSVGDLADAMGIGRQSLYNTFGDKREIFLAAVQRYGEAREQECSRILLESTSALDAVRRLMSKAVEPAACSGCLVGNALPRFAAVDADLSAVLRREMQRPQRVLRSWLSLARDAGELDARADIDAMARDLTVLMSGLIMQAMVDGDSTRAEPSLRVVDLLLSDAARTTSVEPPLQA
ncbi:MAG: TetR/AcrR family transcriptional regulator [Acidobacteriota bacterium]